MVYSRNNGGEKGYARTASISSTGALTAIGSEVLIENTNFHTNRASLTYDPSTDRALYASFNGAQGDDGYAWVIQASGSAASPTVAVGTGTTWAGTTNVSHTASCYDAEYNKIFIAYKISNENRGIIATINAGTNAVTFAGDKTITGVISYNSSLFSVAYDVDAKKITYFYRDGSNSDYLTYKTITSGASSFTVANGAVLKNADIRISSNSGASGTTGKGIALATSDTDTSPVGQLGYSSSYYASITTTVVNASQFVGTARSGADLELSEPPTELVGMANGSITKGKPVIVRTDGDFEQVKVVSQSNTNTGTASQGSLGSMGTYASDMFGMAVAKDGLTYCFTYQNSSTQQACKIGTRTGNSISWGSEIVLASVNSGSHFVSYNNEADVFLTTYTTGNFVKGTAVSYSGNTGTKGSEVTIMDLGNSSGNPNYFYQHWYDSYNKVTVCWAVGGVSGSQTNRSSAVVITLTGTSIALGTLYENASAGGIYQKGCDITGGKHVLYWRNNSSYPSTMVMTVTGSGAISWGTAFTINSTTGGIANAIYNPNYPDKVIIAGVFLGNTFTYAGFNISGTSISNANFFTGGINNANSYIETGGNVGVYSNYSGNYCFVYQTSGSNYYSRYNFATTSDGLTLTVATAVQTNSHGDNQFYAGACASDVDGTVVENHNDRSSGSTYAYYCFNPTFSFTVTSSGPNLTASNFIGFAQQTVADDEDVKIKIVSQTDENQSSLTTASQYFVQTDGSSKLQQQDHPL